MLAELFGNASIEKIFFFLLLNDTCYGTQLSKVFEEPVSNMQKALQRLELGGIIVSTMVGKTRVYQFNPRWPFLKEFKIFLQKAYNFIPESIRYQYYENPVRKRPRRKGKPL
ncbi:MAG: winged helix-turn-helix transcriptional regulator [Chlamydiia bacterium]|nr:winged helix-turn-helix transcriptional regulator [Chlamydiia bacterium]MCP5510147.1 winged helix-turn-helix transcriptional regulator [Chlamydiales bacterium]HPE84709.1 winged helix-turn-helix domain-containing protein [Chlamydiales bacterium]